MNRTLTPAADRPRPELLASLPRLRARLQEQRRFRLDQLAMLGESPDRREIAWRQAFAPDDTADTAAEHDRIRAALVEGAWRALADIETALHPMRTGRYGMCPPCASPSPP